MDGDCAVDCIPSFKFFLAAALTIVAINIFFVTVDAVISGEVVADFNPTREGFLAFVVIVVAIIVIVRAFLANFILVVGLPNRAFYCRPAGDILCILAVKIDTE